MNRWPWRFLLLWTPLLGGCGRSAVATAPIPPVDEAPPARIETATFALG